MNELKGWESGDNKVSIIMPAYNAARFLAAAVQSVRDQTYQNWELLVSDDFSCDDTVKIATQFAKEDPRIKVLAGKANGGPAAARNRALEMAKGRYIAFLDSDDAWLAWKLERQIDFMQRTRAPLSYTSYRRITETGTRVGRQISVPEKLSYSGLLRNTAILTSSAVVDRELAGDFRMKSTYYDDYALWLELLKHVPLAYGLNEDLVRYRVVAGSVSRSKIRSASMVWRTYRKVESLGLMRSILAFAGYAWNAQRKYLLF